MRMPDFLGRRNKQEPKESNQPPQVIDTGSQLEIETSTKWLPPDPPLSESTYNNVFDCAAPADLAEFLKKAQDTEKPLIVSPRSGQVSHLEMSANQVFVPSDPNKIGALLQLAQEKGLENFVSTALILVAGKNELRAGKMISWRRSDFSPHEKSAQVTLQDWLTENGIALDLRKTKRDRTAGNEVKPEEPNQPEAPESSPSDTPSEPSEY